jgi:hypothetical protein
MMVCTTLLPAVVEALRSAGATEEMIAAAVDAFGSREHRIENMGLAEMDTRLHAQVGLDMVAR